MNGLAREARLYEPLPEGDVRCRLCAHRCRISPDGYGICQVRQNLGGRLHTLIYGRVTARQADPIEKKPLFHFHPGTLAFSIAAPGCNFRCAWCQNADLSQQPRETGLNPDYAVVPPEAIAEDAVASGCASIAFTYSEPTLWHEYARDVSQAARTRGLTSVFVTNGYMTQEMLEDYRPRLDAANVDIKAFREETYHRHVGARLQPVLDSVKRMRQLGIWLEITTLVIPGLNDDPGELADLANFMVRELGAHTPWHVSGYYPAYRYSEAPPTPVATLQRAQAIGREAGLSYVYVGNRPGGEDTECPVCGEVVIRREGFRVLENRVRPPGVCPRCGEGVAGVGLAHGARGGS